MSAPVSARRRPSTLGLQIAAVSLLAAVLVAGIAAAITIAAVQRTAREANSARLSQQADLLVVELRRSSGADDRTALLATLENQGISVVLIDGGSATSANDRAVEVVRAAGLLAPGVAFPQTRALSVRGIGWLVEARQIPDSSAGFAVVGLADEGAIAARVLLRRILIAVLIGFGVAVAASLLLARLIAKPMRRTVEVADAMSVGRRDLRVKPGGPAEVRAVAESVNRLADDLQVSEARQQRFIASVSHELRTPLAAVSGLADALADGIVEPADVGDVGRTIRGEAGRLDRLVNDLLDLARVGAADFAVDLAPVDVTALVVEMAHTWRLPCEQRGVVLHVAVVDHPVYVRADARRLRQVLDGLAGNALRQLAAGQPLVFVVAELADGAGCIEIRDGGPGLALADYPQMFSPGVLHERYRTSRPGGGAGLGLALAHGLVSRMGGAITGDPAPEGGVRVTIVLPSAPTPSTAPPPPPVAPTRAQTG